MTPAATGSRSRRSGREGALLNEAQMESLVRTIDLGSINAAARELFISPPSLHQRLGTLEAELGCTLLERCPRGVRPTAEGTRMYTACVACLEQLAAARHDIARLRDENALHEVRIGVTWRPSLHTYYAIEELHASHSNLAVSAVKVTEKPLVSALLGGGHRPPGRPTSWLRTPQASPSGRSARTLTAASAGPTAAGQVSTW